MTLLDHGERARLALASPWPEGAKLAAAAMAPEIADCSAADWAAIIEQIAMVGRRIELRDEERAAAE